jgi:hypothetical protein
MEDSRWLEQMLEGIPPGKRKTGRPVVRWMEKNADWESDDVNGVSGQLRAPVTLPRGSNPRYPLDRGRPQRRSERYEKRIISLPGIEHLFLVVAARSLVDVLTYPPQYLCIYIYTSANIKGELR